MDSARFLKSVWPSQGVYVLATPFTPKGGARTYAHRVFETADAAIRFVEKQRDSLDLFFAPHSFHEAQVWNPTKVNKRTGEVGAFEVRTQANAREARCFFLDLDVGDRADKYATQHDAIAALIQFTKQVQLPKPMVVSSGGGVHVYWLLSDALPSADWVGHADKLKQLVQHHGLRADPARTKDSASVLRVAGSFNFKDRSDPRPVVVLAAGKPTPTGDFLRLLSDAAIRAGVTTKPPLQAGLPDTDFGTNTTMEWQGPPTTMRAVLEVCGQMQRLARLKGNVSEPEWYHTLNLVRFLENGRALTHKISAGHPDYDPDATDAKVAQLEAKGVQPTTCGKLAEVCGDEVCLACPFHGKVKNPLLAARYVDSAPAPVAHIPVGDAVQVVTVPPPPKPFTRLKSGGVSVKAKDAEGNETHTVIYEHDLYPLRRLTNEAAATEQQVWRVVLPIIGEKEFTLDADAMYDRRKLAAAISNQGIYPHPANIPHVMEYMVAYIAELQRLVAAETQANHLGWIDDQTRFVLPDRIIQPDGAPVSARLGLGAQRASAQVHKRGEMAKQIDLLKFYDRPGYLPNQFFILASLAAPIFFATGHHGVVVNASGDAGKGKSQSLYTAASFWGQPELYPINGTNNGATTRGRNERVTTLANLPVCVDEITHMPVKDAVDLAMAVTQPGHRIRLQNDGVERSATGSYKATIMLTTANNSLHGLLAIDNAAGTAGSMRVFEIKFKTSGIHTKAEADDYWHALKEHYGHIGEAFISFVVRNREKVAQRVRDLVKVVDAACNIQSSERFWSATVASVVAAAEIARELGLLPYDPKAIMDWATTYQIPYMRGVVVEEYSAPLGTLADYLESIAGDTLVVNGKYEGSSITNVIRGPRGEMRAHYDHQLQVMWVLKKGFRDYCTRIGADMTRILEELIVPRDQPEGPPRRIVPHHHIKKILGAGTDYAKAQSWCFQIDMAHPDVTGVVDVGTPSDDQAPTAKKSRLRLVSNQ